MTLYKPIDSVCIGMMSPQEAREDIGLARSLLTNGASLEAEFSDGQFDEAMFIGHQSVPASQDIEGGHHPS